MTLEQMLAPWAVYVGAALGPFVQEDAAILAAAAAAMAPNVNSAGVFAAVLGGLIVSDTWKYWVGRLAHTSRRAAIWLQDPRVQGAREKVVRRLGLTLLVARFVPGTRIPLYVACGVFKAPFWRFFIYVSASATLYVSIAFVVMSQLGALVGEQVSFYAPIVVITFILLVLAWGWVRRLRALRRRRR